MLDDLVDALGRKQPTVSALMPKLTAPTSTRPLPARTRRRRRPILRGRQSGVTRAAVEPPLELGHPRLEPLVRLDQLAHPHQQRDRRLPVAVEDRLRLGPLHNLKFAPLKRVPSRQVNAYHFRRVSKTVSGR